MQTVAASGRRVSGAGLLGSFGGTAGTTTDSQVSQGADSLGGGGWRRALADQLSLSACLPACLCLSLCLVCVSVIVPVCLSACLPACLSVCPSGDGGDGDDSQQEANAANANTLAVALASSQQAALVKQQAEEQMMQALFTYAEGPKSPKVYSPETPPQGSQRPWAQ